MAARRAQITGRQNSRRGMARCHLVAASVCGWAFVAAFIVAFVAASYRGCISLAALVAALEAALEAASRLSKTNQANVSKSCKSEKLARKGWYGMAWCVRDAGEHSPVHLRPSSADRMRI